jgi:hypothetical protein
MSIKPIEKFQDPETAYRYYITMTKYFQSQQDKGMLRNVIWEVTLSAGSIHEGYAVFVNVIKSEVNIKNN